MRHALLACCPVAGCTPDTQNLGLPQAVLVLLDPPAAP